MILNYSLLLSGGVEEDESEQSAPWRCGCALFMIPRRFLNFEIDIQQQED